MSPKQRHGMKLLLCDPVPTGPAPGLNDQPHWNWYQKTIAAVARPETKVDFVALKTGYSCPTTPYTAAFNMVRIVERAYEAEKKGYDAFLIGCGRDNGLQECRSMVDIPVVAPIESSVLLASVLGHKFSIIVLGRRWCSVAESRVQSYGLRDKLASIRYNSEATRDEIYDMMFGGKQEKVVDLTTTEMSRAVKEDRAEALLVSCTIVSTVLRMHGVDKVDGAPVVDLITATIKMAENMVDLKRSSGIGPCRASIYYPPITGWEKEIPILVNSD